MLTLVLPTRNEATIIRANLERLLAFLRTTSLVSFRAQREISQDWKVIVADNASTDTTRAIVREVAAHEPRVELLEIPEPGKGGAVLAAWCRAASRQPQAARPHPPAPPLPVGGGETKENFSPSHRGGARGGGAQGALVEREGVGQSQISGLESQIFVFMDADLATNLRHLPELIAAIRSGADIAIGSRYLPGSKTERGSLRRLISWCYRLLLRLFFGLHVSDPPCGFKAVNDRVVRDIIPHVQDHGWFFDTELLIRARAAGLRIAEVPVSWHEPRRRSSVQKIANMIMGDLWAIWRLWQELRSTQW